MYILKKVKESKVTLIKVEEFTKKMKSCVNYDDSSAVFKVSRTESDSLNEESKKEEEK